MPDFNQTGPMGQGPMTGHRMENCSNVKTNLNNETTDSNENAKDNMPENFQERGFGFGRGRVGQGFGMGRQNRFRNGF